MPPQCCRCNGSGRCRTCKCVREGRTCVSCTPGRNRRCENVGNPALEDVTQPHPRIPEAVPPALAIAEDHDPERDAGERCDGEAMDAARLNTFESLPSNRTADAELPFESLPSNRTADAELAISTTPQPSNPADQRPLPGASSPDSHNPLPSPEQIPTSNFQWGEYDGPSLGHVIESAYTEAVHWQRNIFMIPSGKAGKDYVKEQARLFSAYADGTPLEQVALKATRLCHCCCSRSHTPHPRPRSMSAAWRDDCVFGPQETSRSWCEREKSFSSTCLRVGRN